MYCSQLFRVHFVCYRSVQERRNIKKNKYNVEVQNIYERLCIEETEKQPDNGSLITNVTKNGLLLNNP